MQEESFNREWNLVIQKSRRKDNLNKLVHLAKEFQSRLPSNIDIYKIDAIVAAFYIAARDCDLVPQDTSLPEEILLPIAQFQVDLNELSKIQWEIAEVLSEIVTIYIDEKVSLVLALGEMENRLSRL